MKLRAQNDHRKVAGGPFSSFNDAWIWARRNIDVRPPFSDADDYQESLEEEGWVEIGEPCTVHDPESVYIFDERIKVDSKGFAVNPPW